MARSLCIETATKTCSLAVGDRGDCLAYCETRDERYVHSEEMFPLIDQVLEESGTNPSTLGLVAVSSGPGSYTGLRIGGSAAKGFAYGLGIPMVAISTLRSLAFSFLHENPGMEGKGPSPLILAVLDAGGEELYCAAYDEDLRTVLPIGVRQSEALAGIGELRGKNVTFVGYPVEKVRPVFGDGPGVEYRERFPSAVPMVPLAEEAIRNGDTVDPAYFAPDYLKPFSPTRQKKGFRS